MHIFKLLTFLKILSVITVSTSCSIMAVVKNHCDVNFEKIDLPAVISPLDVVRRYTGAAHSTDGAC